MCLCRASHKAGHFEGTLIGGLIQDCNMGDSLAPHVMLAVMWAALANTVPAAFWVVAFLLQPENVEHKQRALASLCPEPATVTYVEVCYSPGAANTCTAYACYLIMYDKIHCGIVPCKGTPAYARLSQAVQVSMTSCRTGWRQGTCSALKHVLCWASGSPGQEQSHGTVCGGSGTAAVARPGHAHGSS